MFNEINFLADQDKKEKVVKKVERRIGQVEWDSARKEEVKNNGKESFFSSPRWKSWLAFFSSALKKGSRADISPKPVVKDFLPGKEVIKPFRHQEIPKAPLAVPAIPKKEESGKIFPAAPLPGYPPEKKKEDEKPVPRPEAGILKEDFKKDKKKSIFSVFKWEKKGKKEENKKETFPALSEILELKQKSLKREEEKKSKPELPKAPVFSPAPAMKKEEKREKEEKKEKKKEERNRNFEFINLDLMKEESVHFFNWRKKIIFFLIYLVMAGLFIGGIYEGLAYWENYRKKESENFKEELRKLNEQISDLDKEGSVKAIVDLNKRLILAREILNNHVYWSNLFKFFEENTISDVYFFGFKGDNKGTYTLSGRARNFAALAEEVRVLRANEKVSRADSYEGKLVVVEGKSQEKGEVSGINFNLNLMADGSIFKRK